MPSRSSEVGSGVATAVSVIEYVPVAAASTFVKVKGVVAKASSAPAGKKKTNKPDPMHGELLAGPAAHQVPPLRNEVRCVEVRVSGEAIQAWPSHSTVKLVNVSVVASKTKDPVGLGLPLVTEKLMVPSMIESAWALGPPMATNSTVRMIQRVFRIFTFPQFPGWARTEPQK